MLCTNIILWTILDHSNLKIETFMEPIFFLKISRFCKIKTKYKHVSNQKLNFVQQKGKKEKKNA
jgi:hypothetical protein